MSGVTDMPFRRLVKRAGRGSGGSEMIASQAMVRETRQSLMMAENTPEEFPMAVQLAGCEPAVDGGGGEAQCRPRRAIIDINFGCPVKKVASAGHAGSALMRDEVHAARILEATVKAVVVPVTLKMRTGWDDNNRNAPALARIAEACGIHMLTVHGRTRCQFYNGSADWALRPPGQGRRVDSGHRQRRHPEPRGRGEALRQSGADGVMIGRGCYGRPWFLPRSSHYLRTGERLRRAAAGRAARDPARALSTTC